jgi:hypothetical protein
MIAARRDQGTFLGNEKKVPVLSVSRYCLSVTISGDIDHLSPRFFHRWMNNIFLFPVDFEFSQTVQNRSRHRLPNSAPKTEVFQNSVRCFSDSFSGEFTVVSVRLF